VAKSDKQGLLGHTGNQSEKSYFQFLYFFQLANKKLPRFYTTDAKMANSGSRLGQMPPAFAGPNFADCLDSHSVYGRELGDGVVDLVLAKREYFAHQSSRSLFLRGGEALCPSADFSSLQTS